MIAIPEPGYEKWEYGPYLNGKALSDAGKHEQALAFWMPAALEGHAACQNAVGWMHLHGVYVDQNPEIALSWFLKSAHQGYPKALFNTALSYAEGWGIEEPDDTTAAHWYRLAAQADYPDAYNNLALLHLHGYGVPKDQPKANVLFEKGAMLGNADAAYNLGCSYHNGRGVPQSDKKAAHWYKLAAEDGHAWAIYMLGLLHLNGIEGVTDPEQGVHCIQTAASVLPKAANYLGTLYELGEVVEQDIPRAFELYLSSAECGFSEGMYNVAAFYSSGSGTEADCAKAVYWFECAWENGDQDAPKALAQLYEHGGPYLQPDVLKANYWKSVFAAEQAAE